MRLKIEHLASDLVDDLKVVRSIAEMINEVDEEGVVRKQVLWELSLALVFAITHVVACLPLEESKKEAVIGGVSEAAYLALGSRMVELTREKYLEHLYARCDEYAVILNDTAPSDTFIRLGTAASSHIYKELDHVKSYVIGSALGELMIHRKKLLDQVVARFKLK